MRPLSGKRPDYTAIYVTHCDRCGREIDARGYVGMECFGCVEAAKAVWPDAKPIAGQVSSS